MKIQTIVPREKSMTINKEGSFYKAEMDFVIYSEKDGLRVARIYSFCKTKKECVQSLNTRMMRGLLGNKINLVGYDELMSLAELF